MIEKDVIVIGGGASGFFTAINLAKNLKLQKKKAQILILEATGQVLKKVKISGGGRCNVTHNIFDTKRFCSRYPRGRKELLSPMSQFQAQDTLQWFKERGVLIRAEADGRMFPTSNSSSAIIDCFEKEIEKYKVEVCTHHPVEDVDSEPHKGFVVRVKGKGAFFSKKVILATGSSPAGYRFSEKLGHKITERAPSLFSFKLKSALLEGLSGLSFPKSISKLVSATGEKFEESGPCLITHWGLSGPAILKISAWSARAMKRSNYKGKLVINWLGACSLEEMRLKLLALKESQPKVLLKNTAVLELPKRFWTSLLNFHKIDLEKRWADLPKKDLIKICESLYRSEFEIHGKNRFKEEFVECGGVDLKEIDFKSMESRLCPGLYITGELLDVDGITGGFNFQNAWTGGWVAAQDLAKKL